MTIHIEIIRKLIEALKMLGLNDTQITFVIKDLKKCIFHFRCGIGSQRAEPCRPLMEFAAEFPRRIDGSEKRPEPFNTLSRSGRRQT